MSLLHASSIDLMHPAQAVFSVLVSRGGYSLKTFDFVQAIFPLSNFCLPRTPLTFDDLISSGVNTLLTRFAAQFFLEQDFVLTSKRSTCMSGMYDDGSINPNSINRLESNWQGWYGCCDGGGGCRYCCCCCDGGGCCDGDGDGDGCCDGGGGGCSCDDDGCCDGGGCCDGDGDGCCDGGGGGCSCDDDGCCDGCRYCCDGGGGCDGDGCCDGGCRYCCDGGGGCSCDGGCCWYRVCSSFISRCSICDSFSSIVSND